MKWSMDRNIYKGGKMEKLHQCFSYWRGIRGMVRSRWHMAVGPVLLTSVKTDCGLYSDVNKMLAQLLKSASIHQFIHPSVLSSVVFYFTVNLGVFNDSICYRYVGKFIEVFLGCLSLCFFLLKWLFPRVMRHVWVGHVDSHRTWWCPVPQCSWAG